MVTVGMQYAACEAYRRIRHLRHGDLESTSGGPRTLSCRWWHPASVDPKTSLQAITCDDLSLCPICETTKFCGTAALGMYCRLGPDLTGCRLSGTIIWGPFHEDHYLSIFKLFPIDGCSAAPICGGYSKVCACFGGLSRVGVHCGLDERSFDQ